MLSPTTMAISGTNNHKISSSSSSSSMIASNIDLLTEILLRLPVKSLLVFKRVSKLWLSHISSPDFIQQHCIRSKLCRSGVFLLYMDLDEHGQEYEFIWHNKSVEVGNRCFPYHVTMDYEYTWGLLIKDSCNGLILCMDMTEKTKTLVVCNLSTGQYREIAPPKYRKKKDSLSSLSLVFDPLKSLDYEIVCIWGSKFEIYSSKTKSWRLCDTSFYYMGNYVFDSSGLLWNGCLNWFNCENWDLVYFDIEQQVLKTLPFNPIENSSEKWKDDFIKYFGASMGRMYLVQSPQIDNSCFCLYSIFEMEVDYKGWEKKYVFDLNQPGKALCQFNILMVEQANTDQEEEGLKVFIHAPYEIVSYDLNKKSFEDICEYARQPYDVTESSRFLSTPVFDRQFIQSQRRNGYDYIESLANV